MRAWRGVVAGLLAVPLVTGCAMVQDPRDKAKELATRNVRTKATRNATDLGASLRATDAAGVPEVVRRHLEYLDPSPDPDDPSEDGLLGSSVASDGTVRLDLVFRDGAYATGGFGSYEDAVVQLCVTVTATPGPGGQVRLDGLDCPAAVAAPGVVDEEVDLDREGVLSPPPRRYQPCLSGGDSHECPGG
jgi:hypothetical protein